MPKPNVLFIILDTLRRDRLSTYGCQRETSPHFDAFAADSTLFERAVAPAQWTVPSHASMFTGLYPSTHQLTQANGLLSGSYPTLAEILQADGYHTAAFCANPLVGLLNHGLQRGFTEFYNYSGAMPNRPADAHRSCLYREFKRHFRRFGRHVGNQFAHSDTAFRIALRPAFTRIWTRMINFKGNTPRTIDDLIAYLDSYHAGGSERPLFTFLNLLQTHLPFNPPQDYLDKLAPTLRHNRHAYRFMRRFNADAARWASPPDPPLQDWQRQTLDDFYDAEVAYQDDHLGRLLNYLRQSGLLDNTMVLISADHGEALGDHNLFGHGFGVHQELVHVPLVIYDPERFPKPTRLSANVSTRRIFHTVLEAANVTPPLDEADPNANVYGLSLQRIAERQPSADDDLAFSEAFPPETFLNVLRHRNPRIIPKMGLHLVRRAVYAAGHKLTLLDNQIEALYDVAHDPAETHDLTAQHPEVVADLQHKVKTFVAQAERYRAGGEAFAEVSQEVVEHLRALGYIE